VAHLATTDMTHRLLLLPQMRRLADEGWDVVAISAAGPWVEEIEAAGVRHVTWPHAVRAWAPGEDACAFASLVGILRAERPDVLHCHNPKPGVLGRMAGRAVGVPVVLNTVHGFYAAPDDAARRRVPVMVAERLAARWSSFELYQSEEDLAWARELKIARPGRSRRLGNGVDLARFDPDGVPASRRDAIRAELGIAPDDVLVGTVGRMVVEKGYREYFDAAARVRAVRPDVRFVVVGEPDAEKQDAIGSEEIARASRDVIMAGWRADVVDLLAAIDVFVLASWREGLPRAAIEAAAMGRALILTDIRGCREVAGADAGLLVEPRNAAAIADAVLALSADPARREALGRAARARAIDRFDERRVMDTVAAVSRTLAGGVDVPPAHGIRIRRARLTDAARIADLHAAAMPTAFLPSLGTSFLRRFHRGLIAFPDAGCYVAESEAGVIGFVSGAPSTARFARWFVRHHGPAAAVSAIAGLLGSDGWRGARESLRYAVRRDEGTDMPDAELIAIAVAPQARGRGAGTMLGQAFLDAMAARGVDEVRVVVGPEFSEAIRLYERLGFAHRIDLAVHVGTASRVLVVSGMRSRTMRGHLRRIHDDGAMPGA
jgi:glycosyltransferase involved in cell wall biosynthesis/ribosomal protein S18 acetylase RimI-like enzyme